MRDPFLEIDILRFWKNTNCTQAQVAAHFNVSQGTVSVVICKNAPKRLTENLRQPFPETPPPSRPPVFDGKKNPCGLSLKGWPVCFGNGCYHAGASSQCLAFNTARDKNPELINQLWIAHKRAYSVGGRD